MSWTSATGDKAAVDVPEVSAVGGASAAGGASEGGGASAAGAASRSMEGRESFRARETKPWDEQSRPANPSSRCLGVEGRRGYMVYTHLQSSYVQVNFLGKL